MERWIKDMNKNDRFWRLQYDKYLALAYDSKNKYESWQPGRWASNRSVVKLLGKYFKDINKSLELGAGSAAFSLELHKQYGCKIAAVDMSLEAKKYAQLIAGDMGIPISYKHGNIFNETSRADLVMSLGVIEHYSHKKQVAFIRKCAELSNKYILIAIPNQESILFRSYIEWANQDNGEYEEEHKPMTVYELRDMMKQCGLNVVHIDGFQVFLSEKEFWNETNIQKIPLYIDMKKHIAEKNINWPDFPIMNFSCDDIPQMVDIETKLGEKVRLKYGFMTYVLAEK